jgi:hypothetical protein
MLRTHQRAAARALFGLVLLCGFDGLARAQESPWKFGENLGIGFDTNIGNAEKKPEVQSSTFGALDYQLDYNFRPLESVSVQVRAALQAQDYFRFNRLSNAKGSGMLRLVYRPGPGFYVPELSAWGSAGYWRFGSYIRTSDEYRYGLGLAENITTRIDLRLSLTGSRRISNTRVFTLHGDSAGLNFDWQVLDPLALYGGVLFHYGQVVSSGSPDGKIIRVAEVIEPDDAFGGFATDQFAYRLRAHTRIGSLGLNYQFDPSWTVDAQTQYIDTRGGFGNNYSRWISIVSLLLRF